MKDIVTLLKLMKKYAKNIILFNLNDLVYI